MALLPGHKSIGLMLKIIKELITKNLPSTTANRIREYTSWKQLLMESIRLDKEYSRDKKYHCTTSEKSDLGNKNIRKRPYKDPQSIKELKCTYCKKAGHNYRECLRYDEHLKRKNGDKYNRNINNRDLKIFKC
ncbi:hypothetical protein ENBRE01_1992 [Enteropsectra breve]|nr:hypothetical protein ENBRE01_1992 [Enteropsectra breve]